jgi:hypothetical protein
MYQSEPNRRGSARRKAGIRQRCTISFELFQSFRILGQGVPVFAGQAPRDLRLLETRRWEESGHVLLRYAVPHADVQHPAKRTGGRLRPAACCTRGVGCARPAGARSPGC